MLELYNFADSTCSQKVRICLAEKGISWADRRLDGRNFDHLTPEYLALNPNGVVPTLVHDGVSVIDSTVIMEYLDDAFPEPALRPTTPQGRAEMRTWLRFFDEVSTPAVRYPSYNMALAANTGHMSDAERRALADRRPIKKYFFRRMGRDGFPQEDLEAALERLRRTVGRLEAALEDGRPWLLGSQFTLADICITPTMDRLADLGLQALWEENNTAVTAWLKRLQSRPSVQKTYYKGARLSDTYRIRWSKRPRKVSRDS